jgi:hypothetical protein
MINADQIFPYAATDELQLRLEDLQLKMPDDTKVTKGDPSILIQGAQLDLSGTPKLRSWSKAKLSIRLLLPEDAIRSVLPDTRGLGVDTVPLVSMRCRATRLRRRIPLSLTQARANEWGAEVEFRRDDTSGAVELVPLLVRTRELPDPTFDPAGIQLGRFRGAILGVGQPFILRIDPPKEKNGAITVRWDDFRESDNPWCREHNKHMFFVDTSEDNPEVVLNSAHEILRQVLNKKRPIGAEAGVKASILTYIAHCAWSSFFVAALTACVPEEPDLDASVEIDWPSDPFKEKVLKRMLRHVFPRSGNDLDRLRMAIETLRDPLRVSTLMSQLHGGIQTVLKVDELIVKALETAAEED